VGVSGFSEDFYAMFVPLLETRRLCIFLEKCFRAVEK